MINLQTININKRILYIIRLSSFVILTSVIFFLFNFIFIKILVFKRFAVVIYQTNCVMKSNFLNILLIMVIYRFIRFRSFIYLIFSINSDIHRSTFRYRFQAATESGKFKNLTLYYIFTFTGKLFKVHFYIFYFLLFMHKILHRSYTNSESSYSIQCIKKIRSSKIIVFLRL